MFSDRVELHDVGAGTAQPPDHGQFIFQRDAIDRRRQQRASAAGDQRDREVARSRVLQQGEDLTRALHAGLGRLVHPGRSCGVHRDSR